jgi:hypothetical protein
MLSIIEFCLLNFSLTSFCGGRNDLSPYFIRNTSTTTKSYQSRSFQTRTIEDEPLSDFDWDGLATDLLSYNESEICQQSYVTGSGNVMQITMVNRSCRCVLFDQIFNSNTKLKQFATLLRPILYGKIYYHPSNIHYDQIIKQINQTFESLDELVRLFRQIEIIIQPTYELFQSICDLFSNSSMICQQRQTYQTPISLFTIATEFIACSERNRFVPMNSESDMVNEGQNKSVTNNFLAAIEFLDQIADNESLPKHIRFKIRMALDYVDSTFRTEDK